MSGRWGGRWVSRWRWGSRRRRAGNCQRRGRQSCDASLPHGFESLLQLDPVSVGIEKRVGAVRPLQALTQMAK